MPVTLSYLCITYLVYGGTVELQLVLLLHPLLPIYLRHKIKTLGMSTLWL